MLDKSNSCTETVINDEDFDLIRELEQNTPDEIQKRRLHFRYSVKAGLTLQPGNASDLLKFKLQGVTRDISQGGLGAVFPLPVNVGDIYRLQFDPSKVDLPLTFARCVSCTLVREGAYSCGFKFFQDILLPRNLQQQMER